MAQRSARSPELVSGASRTSLSSSPRTATSASEPTRRAGVDSFHPLAFAGRYRGQRTQNRTGMTELTWHHSPTRARQNTNDRRDDSSTVLENLAGATEMGAEWLSNQGLGKNRGTALQYSSNSWPNVCRNHFSSWRMLCQWVAKKARPKAAVMTKGLKGETRRQIAQEAEEVQRIPHH